MSHQKILALLEGRDSTRPMRFDDLREASGLQPATLTMVLDQMANAIPASINRATITKGGLTQVMVWPTGVIGPFFNPSQLSQLEFRRAQEQRSPAREVHKSASYAHKTEPDMHEPAAKVQPKTSISEKEQTMNETTCKVGSGKQPGELNSAIYNKIVEHPGISHAALIKHALEKCPEATEKQAIKTVSNMRHVTKKIRAEGDRGNYTYHLNRDAVTPVPTAQKKAKPERVAKVRPGKLVVGAEAAALRGDPQPAEAAAAPVRRVKSEIKVPDALPVSQPAKFFSLYLDDEDHLHITIGEDDLMLLPEQTARLHRFMSRVQIGSAA